MGRFKSFRFFVVILDESLLDHRNSSHWFNEDTASSTGAGGGGGGGQRSRNVSTGGVSSTADLLMQQTASVSNQVIPVKFNWLDV